MKIYLAYSKCIFEYKLVYFKITKNYLSQIVFSYIELLAFFAIYIKKFISYEGDKKWANIRII